MPQTAILSGSHYKILLTDLKKIILSGRQRAAQAVNRENIQMYWEVGRRIAQEQLTDNAGYGDSIYEEIAGALAISSITIRQAVIFFNAFPNSTPRGTILTWAHLREISRIASKREREWYLKQIEREVWTRDKLVTAIKRDAFGEALTQTSQEPIPKLKRPTDQIYVFKSSVLRVIDGDTLLLLIDVGFTMKKEQRVRLAEIDTPSIDLTAGKKAYVYVRDQLAQVPFVTIKTNKVDIYGRYVANVFYSFLEQNWRKVFQEGRYLNQELLDRGHAKRI
jgi:endonuclease YncB( thermonuclease family)